MLAVYEAKWAQARRNDPAMNAPSAMNLNRLVRDFRKADLDRIAIAADEVGRAHVDGRPLGSAGSRWDPR